MIAESPLKLSALHHRHLAMGATMVDRDGWTLPARYAGGDAELRLVREGVGLCDVSPLGKLLVEGAGSASLLRSLAPGNDLPAIGRMLLMGRTGEEEGIHSGRVIVARLTDDQLFFLAPPEETPALKAFLERSMQGCLHLVDMTSVFAGMLVAGPRGRDVLAKLTELDLAPGVFGDLACTSAGLAQVHALVMRRDRGSVPCHEVYVSRDLGEFVWDAALAAGAEFGIAPFGGEALQRLEEGK